MAWSYEINPAKSLNGAGLWILNGPGTKSSVFNKKVGMVFYKTRNFSIESFLKISESHEK